MLRRSLALAVLAGCAHRVPLATSADPDLCLHDATAPATLVAPHGDRVGVCYGEGDCVVVDHARGVVVERAQWPLPEQAFPPALKASRPVERFTIERTESETTVCDGERRCRTLRLPGVADQLTVLPAVSADGSELYFVARDGGHAFLDTVDLHARRTGRVPLAVGNADDHLFSVERIGSAVLVRDSIIVGLNDERSSQVLVDPFTGARRELLTGSAIALDDHTAVVVEGQRAAIVGTRALVTLATHVAPGRSSVAAPNGAIAVVAFANPPTIVTVENRRFTRQWRLPVCR